MIGYSYATAALAGEPPDNKLYEYVTAANGLFVRARSPLLSVTTCILATAEPLRGLSALDERFDWALPRLPADLVADFWRDALDAGSNELLGYFYCDDGDWRLDYPAQEQLPGSCRPLDPFNPLRRRAHVEIHSHHRMPARFSDTDDHDEKGFRVYAVMGRLYSERPLIRFRVGCHGYHQMLTADRVAELPAGLGCAVAADLRVLGEISDRRAIWR